MKKSILQNHEELLRIFGIEKVKEAFGITGATPVYLSPIIRFARDRKILEAAATKSVAALAEKFKMSEQGIRDILGKHKK